MKQQIYYHQLLGGKTIHYLFVNLPEHSKHSLFESIAWQHHMNQIIIRVSEVWKRFCFAYAGLKYQIFILGVFSSK